MFKNLDPKYLNALKAGLKTASFVFFTGLLAVLTNVASALQSAVIAGNPPDLDFVPGAMWALLSALAVGVINAGSRFMQAAGLPFITPILDKLFGAIPAYVSENTGVEIKATGAMVEPPSVDNYNRR